LTYWIEILSPVGVEAEFTVGSATLALDLVLRSQRAGLWWSAEARTEAGADRLSLRSLRHLARSSAQTESERELLDQVEWQHELASSYALN